MMTMWLCQQQRVCTKLFLIITFLAVQCTMRTEGCGRVRPRSRIIGGVLATPGDFPWLVAIMRNGIGAAVLECGGTIINQQFILTAASCLAGMEPRDFDVVAGEYRLAFNEGTEQYFDSLEFIIHEEFHAALNYLNDIALIKLSKPIVYTDYIQPVCLPPNGHVCTGDVELTGWGFTIPNGIISEYLRTVVVPVVSDQDCKAAYGQHAIVDTNICTGRPEGGKESCVADTGGAATQGDYICGIMSWSQGCAQPGLPGVNTEVVHYLDWINSHIQSASATI